MHTTCAVGVTVAPQLAMMAGSQQAKEEATMWAVKRLGRRAWLTRTGAGLVTVWAGLDFGRGQQGWGVLLGRPARTAHAQNTPAMHTLPVTLEFTNAAGQANSVNAFVLVRGREVAIV